MSLPRVLEPRASRPNLTLGVLALAGLAFALLQSLVAPALTTIQHEVGASESGVTWVLTSYLLSAAVATPILGRLGDVYGKRRVLIVALGGLAAGALVAAVASSSRLLGLLAAGAAVLAAWVRSELRSRSPLVDMRMMAIRGVWSTNLVGVMLGAGMFTAFVLIPQFAQMPARAGFGFASSVTAAGVFLLPLSLVMLLIGALAGRLERRFGSKPPVLAGIAFAFVGFVMLLVGHDDSAPIYVASGLLGVGIGLAFAAMANLIVQAVDVDETGVATGMNTVARTVGGAFGGQLAATFVAGSVAASGLPTVQSFDAAFLMALVALAIAFVSALLIPGRPSRAGALAPATEVA